MKRRLKTGRKALRLAIFAVESTHEQTNFYRPAIAVGGDLSGIDRSHSGSTQCAHAPEAPAFHPNSAHRRFRSLKPTPTMGARGRLHSSAFGVEPSPRRLAYSSE